MVIIEEIKSIKSNRDELKKFGLTLGAVFALLGGFLWWREKNYFFSYLIVSVLFFFFGLVLSALLKPFHKIWMSIAILMGWFMTRIILIILFYLIVTPIGFLARLFGKDFLNTKFNKNLDSYWIPKKISKFDKKNYENQF
jgi:multisubunit Na+/H+ antiporter MnhG subunit